MKTQEQINALWEQSTGPEGMRITMLTPPPQGKVGLRRPYQYDMTRDAISNLRTQLHELCKERPIIQCGLARWKRLTYGWKLEIFILSHSPGLCGDDSAGITAEGWELLTSNIKAALDAALNTDAPIYAEEWTPDQKFQMRYETYIFEK